MPQGHGNFAVTCLTSNFAYRYTLSTLVLYFSQTRLCATLDSVPLNSINIALIKPIETTSLRGTVILQ